MVRKDGEREGARDRPSCPTGRVCRGEKFSHTLSWDATATAGGDEGIPCPQGQYSAVQGELLQPAMRNLPERADNLAAGDGRECGAVQQGYGEAHLPACALYREGPFMTTPTENRETPE